MVIIVDLSKRVLEVPSTVGVAAQEASRKACAVLEDEISSENFLALAMRLSK